MGCKLNSLLNQIGWSSFLNADSKLIILRRKVRPWGAGGGGHLTGVMQGTNKCLQLFALSVLLK